MLHNARIPSRWLATLFVVFLGLPWVVIQFIPGDSIEPFEFRAVLHHELGRSANGQLTYWQTDVHEGDAPGATIVLAFDRNYTRGFTDSTAVPGASVWFQGGPMTPEVFYGEQYLFYGLPQVYVRQVKTGLLWPDQWTELRVLYLSPLETLAAPMQALFLVRAEECTIRLFSVLLARCILLGGAGWAILVDRLRGRSAAFALLVYAIVAMLLTIPILGDLY
jgi:hypothetical protein